MITTSYGPAIAAFCHSKRHRISTKKETGLWEIPAYSEAGSACIPSQNILAQASIYHIKR